VLLRVTVCAALFEPTVCVANVNTLGETLAEAVAAAPVPLKVTVWVAPVTPPELSVIVNVLVRAPVAAGVNVTEITQLDPAPKEAPQPLVGTNSVPAAATLVIVSATLPVLLSVTACAALVVPTVCVANVSAFGETPAAAVPAPVPVNVTLCVAPTLPELSTICNVAVRVPEAEGVNVTEILQLALAASVVPQALVSAKSPGLLPSIPTLVIVNGPLPVLLNVSVCAAVVVLTAVEANVKLPGDTPAVGTPIPVPLNATVCVAPATFPELSVIVRVPVCVPVAVGVNVTEIVQVPAAATVVQLLVSANTLPVTVTPVTVSVANPESVTVTVSAVLVVFRF
jgi:hypothetical protein